MIFPGELISKVGAIVCDFGIGIAINEGFSCSHLDCGEGMCFFFCVFLKNQRHLDYHLFRLRHLQ